MFRLFFRGRNQKSSNSSSIEWEDKILDKNLMKNIALFKSIFEGDETIKFRIINVNKNAPEICLIYIDGIVDSRIIREGIIYPLRKLNFKDKKVTFSIETIRDALDVNEVKVMNRVYEIVEDILNGETLILVDKFDEGLIVESKQFEERAITDSTTERVVRGPREGLVESIMTNISLIRKRIKTPDLKFKFMKIGRRTGTNVCICYIEGLANKKILNELYKRLESIDIDGILESAYIEELIKDSPLSPFNTIGYTERADKVVSKLLEGRIALIIDGTPFVLTVPFLFMEYFQWHGDYYDSFYYGTINRLLTYLGFFLATSVPAIYVALTTFHQEMIPTPLLLSISALREGVPFPTILEAILMALAFEIVREAGLRIPAPIGPSISFVGALIIGQAAVEARIFSAPIVIVTALTGVTNFLIPQMVAPLNIIRMIFLLLASFLGLYGYIFGVIGLTIHLMSLRSFGVPYMMYMGSIEGQEIKDTVIRAPWWLMYLRPRIIGSLNAKRFKQGREIK